MSIPIYFKKAFIFCCVVQLSTVISPAIAQELNIAWYAGGTKSDFIEQVVVDHHGNIIVCGATTSKKIATNGAYQHSKSSANDFFISKYRSNGLIVWTTYYGGNDDDYPFTMTVDLSDNIYVGGETLSTTGVASPGAYQTSNAGNYDALLVKLDSSGNRLWATYFGGSKKEQLLCCATDAQGNVFIGGYTESNSNIATANGYQTAFGGGAGDAFLAKFNSAGIIQWSTYYGGNDQDRIHGLAIDHKGKVIAYGTSPSTNGIATSGAFQTINAGKNDVFIAKFTTNGSLKWATYFGAAGTDRARECCVDDSNNIYITGYTASDSLMATPGAYQYYWTAGYDTDASPTYDAFLAKFSGGGQRIWSTYFGGVWDEWQRSVAWHDGFVAIAGLTASTTNIATADALQPQIGGGEDAYLAVFTDAGNIVWSTYYGGSKDEMLGIGYGADVDFDADGNLILAFTTESDSLPSLNSFYEPATHPDGMIVSLTTNFFQRLQQNHFVKNDLNLFIYPNPATDQCTIVIEAVENTEAQLSVSDVSGNILLRKKIVLSEGKKTYSVDLSGFLPGCYDASVIFNDGRKNSATFIRR